MRAQASQFEFRTNCRTASLADLISDLNETHINENGEAVTTKDLWRTIQFLEQTVGMSIESRNAPLPLSMLKTIKLLFTTNAGGGKHLFRLLAPPNSAGNATMEFSTVTTLPRDGDAANLITQLTKDLSLEIDAGKIDALSRMLSERPRHTTAEKLLLHAERTNDEVQNILSCGLMGNDATLARAYRTLSDQIGAVHPKRSAELYTPANEALFVYLETLAFRHFVIHHRRHLEETRVKSIGSVGGDTEAFLLSIGGPHPSIRQFSVNGFHRIVFEWIKEISALVAQATGFDTEARQLKKHTVRAKALLVSYLYRSFDSTDNDAELLSFYDILAALCTFRYQQGIGTEYKPYWHGQTDQGKNPLRLFDKGLRDKSDPHQHQGVLQIFLNRFYEYQASFEGTMESHRAWMEYQTSRLDAYVRILELNDILGVTWGLTSLNFLSVDAAKDIAIRHLADQTRPARHSCTERAGSEPNHIKP